MADSRPSVCFSGTQTVSPIGWSGASSRRSAGFPGAREGWPGSVVSGKVGLTTSSRSQARPRRSWRSCRATSEPDEAFSTAAMAAVDRPQSGQERSAVRASGRRSRTGAPSRPASRTRGPRWPRGERKVALAMTNPARHPQPHPADDKQQHGQWALDRKRSAQDILASLPALREDDRHRCRIDVERGSRKQSFAVRRVSFGRDAGTARKGVRRPLA